MVSRQSDVDRYVERFDEAANPNRSGGSAHERTENSPLQEADGKARQRHDYEITS